MSFSTDFPSPEGPIPPEPGPPPAITSLTLPEYREWDMKVNARNAWVIKKRRSVVAAALDELDTKGLAGLTAGEKIAFIVGISYLEGTLQKGSNNPLDLLMGGFF